MKADKAEFDKDWLIVRYHPKKVTPEVILQTVKNLKYEPKVVTGGSE